MAFSREYFAQEPTRAEIDKIDGPLLLEFGAPWCGYCLELEPHLQELFAQFPEVRHIRIYDGRGQPLGRSFRVKLWPNLVFLHNGRLVQQMARPSPDQAFMGFEALRRMK